MSLPEPNLLARCPGSVCSNRGSGTGLRRHNFRKSDANFCGITTRLQWTPGEIPVFDFAISPFVARRRASAPVRFASTERSVVSVSVLEFTI